MPSFCGFEVSRGSNTSIVMVPPVFWSVTFDLHAVVGEERRRERIVLRVVGILSVVEERRDARVRPRWSVNGFDGLILAVPDEDLLVEGHGVGVLQPEGRVERLAAVARPADAVFIAEWLGPGVDRKCQPVARMIDRVVVGVRLVDHPDEQPVLEREALDLVRCGDREAELVRALGEGRVVADVRPVLDEVVAIAERGFGAGADLEAILGGPAVLARLDVVQEERRAAALERDVVQERAGGRTPPSVW